MLKKGFSSTVLTSFAAARLEDRWNGPNRCAGVTFQSCSVTS